MIPAPKDEYDPIIPGANDFLAVSQADFLSNFGQLYNAFVANHVALDSVTLTPGNHTNIQLLEQAQGPVTNVGEISLYSKEVNYNDKITNELYLRYQGGNPVGPEVRLTNYQIYSNPVIQPGQFGFFTFLPGALIVYFGGVVFSATDSQTLYLNPFICTNIMAFNFCVSGTSPNFPPDGNFLSQRPGLITVFQARKNSFIPGVLYYYIVLGNTT